MTVLELNELGYISANIHRILQHLEKPDRRPSFFIQTGAPQSAPVMDVYRAELEDLMREYQRRAGYIEQIRDPWTRQVFIRRFLDRESFRKISVDTGMLSGTLKQTVYSFLKQNPEGYVSCRDLAEAWDVSIDTVERWCQVGALPGAKKRAGVGSDGWQRWIIPAEAVRPKTIRKYRKKGKG